MEELKNSDIQNLEKNPTEESKENKEKLRLDFTEKSKEKIISFLKDKYNLAFLGVLVLAFLIRLKYINQESIWNDSAVHLWYAIKVTKEPLFFFSQNYLMGDYGIPQTIMAFFYLLTKNILLSGKIVAMGYGLVGIVFMYLLGKELKNKFMGLIAAALLAFNHLFWFYSVRPLGDSPLLVTTIILLYCMVKLEKEKKLGWGIASGAMFLVAMLTKRQSVIFIIALLIYYLIFKRKEMFKNKAVLASWLIPLSITLAAELFVRFTGGGSLYKYIFTLLFVTFRGMPFGFEAAGMLQWIFSWYLVPLVVLGVIFVIIYRNKNYYFGLVLFAFYWIFFEVGVDNTQDRYMLPLFSVAVILAVFALEELGAYLAAFTHRMTKYLLVIAVVLFISWNYYHIGDPLIYNKSFSYIGYEEAGRWIKENVPAEAPIFAGEYRSIRLFSEREFGGPADEDLGGTIWNLRSPYYADYYTGETNQTAFEEDVKRLAKESDVYLEVDIWEYYQPKWYWPLKQESFDYFSSLGFNMVKVVEREVPTEKGLQKVPVIFILKKNKEA